MMFKATILSALLAVAAAMPTSDVEARGGSGVFSPNDWCPKSLLYTSFECCVATVLDGVLDLDCTPPKNIPADCATPEAACDWFNKGQPQCCTLPVLGLGVLCKDVFDN